MDNSITTYRCCDCKKIVTSIAIKKYGGCPRCGCGRVRGGSPTLFETIL